MKIKDLLTELDKLNLPKDKFAITSSGPLGIRNIREINDLDIIVYPCLWQELSKRYPIIKEDNFESIYIKNIQILGPGSNFGNPKFGNKIDQINNADLFDDYRFVKLETVLEIKKSQNRSKDIADVKLIKEYLLKNSR